VVDASGVVVSVDATVVGATVVRAGVVFLSGKLTVLLSRTSTTEFSLRGRFR
jgi:hypothetical protein